jgi:hypothetical protein
MEGFQMAVMIQFEWPGLTREQFEEARRVIGWETNAPKGSIVQTQGWDEGVFKAQDLWESREDWDNFLQNRILPNLAPLGVSGQPTIRVFDAYCVFIPGRQPASV